MITGRVKGRYWSTKRVTTLPQGALLDIELENGSHLVAFDPIGCGGSAGPASPSRKAPMRRNFS